MPQLLSSLKIYKYLDTEIQYKAISGHYDSPPFGPSSHFSPFMSRPKNDSEFRRIIIDLSWPLQGSINYFTENNCYLDTIFKLQYPTVDSVTEYLRKLGKGAYIYKIHLSRAFRQIPVDPHDYDYAWHGKGRISVT